MAGLKDIPSFMHTCLYACIIQYTEPRTSREILVKKQQDTFALYNSIFLFFLNCVKV